MDGDAVAANSLEDILTPVDIDYPIAQDTLLNMISCGCGADGCGSVMWLQDDWGVLLCPVYKSALIKLATMPCLLDAEEETEESTPVSQATDDEDDD